MRLNKYISFLILIGFKFYIKWALPTYSSFKKYIYIYITKFDEEFITLTKFDQESITLYYIINSFLKDYLLQFQLSCIDFCS